MDEEAKLQEVKTVLKELSDYNDEEIKLWISVVVDYMRGAGVSENRINSTSSIGLIALGVEALRLREDFSETFKSLVIQYAMRGD